MDSLLLMELLNKQIDKNGYKVLIGSGGNYLQNLINMAIPQIRKVLDHEDPIKSSEVVRVLDMYAFIGRPKSKQGQEKLFKHIGDKLLDLVKKKPYVGISQVKLEDAVRQSVPDEYIRPIHRALKPKDLGDVLLYHDGSKLVSHIHDRFKDVIEETQEKIESKRKQVKQKKVLALDYDLSAYKPLLEKLIFDMDPEFDLSFPTLTCDEIIGVAKPLINSIVESNDPIFPIYISRLLEAYTSPTKSMKLDEKGAYKNRLILIAHSLYDAIMTDEDNLVYGIKMQDAIDMTFPHTGSLEVTFGGIPKNTRLFYMDKTKLRAFIGEIYGTVPSHNK